MEIDYSMSKIDANKAARKQRLEELKTQRRNLQTSVFNELKHFEEGRYCNEPSLNAFVGSKHGEYVDLRNEVIKTSMEFTTKWLSGLKEKTKESLRTGRNARHNRMSKLLTGEYPCFKKYVKNFLESSFLKYYESHYKQKPKIDESEFWFGSNDDEYGLLVTPRFANNSWENDGSEIRHFKHPYWTISHVLATGLCVKNDNRICEFSSIADYLNFFHRSIRITKSNYQIKLGKRYIEYVESHKTPESIPLLIPELRYDPLKRKHQHRLDFLIINPWTMSKIGFEISPWSSHGKLAGKDKNLKELNIQAKENFEREMEKHKKYWRKYGINYITYTDYDLENLDKIWFEMKKYLTLDSEPEQLEIHLIREYLE